MRFNSVIYWAFLASVVAILWLLPARWRRWWLLLASYVFYGSWHYPYLVLLVGTGAVAHFGAVWMVQGDRRTRGRLVLGVMLVELALFKYLDFLVANLNVVTGLVGLDELSLPAWVLPLGISFYVFQAMSYVVDVMRRREGVHGYWSMQLYLAYFPQLIAGPIMRAKELVPQLERTILPDSTRLRDGLQSLLSGLFLKIVLADGLAPNIDKAFARDPNVLGAIDVWVMAVAFGLQVYFDFAGYSRIAIGSAKLCGIDLVDNFNHPYVATSPVEFWNRWHMSLSRWIRDYLFLPLVGRKVSKPALVRAALVAMTLCGVWHGAGWTFVLWGLYHGVLIAGYHLVARPRAARRPAATTSWRSRLAAALSIAVTFGLVSFGWLLFRAQGVGQAGELMATAVMPIGHLGRALPGTFYLHVFALVLAVWMAPGASAWLARSYANAIDGGRAFPRLGWSAAQGLGWAMMAVLSLIYLQGQQAFVYFQF